MCKKYLTMMTSVKKTMQEIEKPEVYPRKPILRRDDSGRMTSSVTTVRTRVPFAHQTGFWNELHTSSAGSQRIVFNTDGTSAEVNLSYRRKPTKSTFDNEEVAAHRAHVLADDAASNQISSNISE